MNYVALAILILMCASGFMIVSYKTMAQTKHWPIGSLFHNPGGWVSILGFMAMISSPLLSVRYNPWWTALIVLFLGWLMAYVLTSHLKKHTQLVSLLLLAVSFVLLVVINS